VLSRFRVIEIRHQSHELNGFYCFFLRDILEKPKIDSPDLSNTSVTDITLNVITDLM
jgi:hypothetical protein